MARILVSMPDKFLESIIKNYVFNNDISVCENNIPYKLDIDKEL